MSVGCFTPYRQLGSYSRQKQVWTFSILVENKLGLFQSLGDRIYEMKCLFVAVGLNARFIVLPHRDNMKLTRFVISILFQAAKLGFIFSLARMGICVNNSLIKLEFHQICHWPNQISTGICPRASANFAACLSFQSQIPPPPPTRHPQASESRWDIKTPPFIP